MTQQSIEVLKKQDTVSIHMHLRAYTKKEKPGIYVSYCPALDLYSQGDTVKEAKQNIIEATELFIEGCIEDGTLESILRECGFHLASEKPVRKRQSKISEIFGGNPFKIPAEIPLYAMS